MSYIMRHLTSRATLGRQPLYVSFFHSSRARLALSESDRDAHEDIPDRNAKIDHHKHDSVKKQEEGKGEWKPELASNSEQAVGADKHEKSMKEMQEEGAKKSEQGQQPSGSS